MRISIEDLKLYGKLQKKTKVYSNGKVLLDLVMKAMIRNYKEKQI